MFEGDVDANISPVRSKVCFVAAFVGLLVTIGGCALSESSNGTFEKLSNIMDERKELWFSENSVRDTDVSDLVCPFVSESSMEEANTSNPQKIDFYLTAGETDLPPGTKVWSIKRHINPFTWQVLTIRITPSGDCMAIYQHIS